MTTTDIFRSLAEITAFCAGAGALLTAALEIRLKYRSRADLARLVADHREARERINLLLDENRIGEAAELMRGYAAALPATEREQALSALSQRSERGQAGYMRDVSHAGFATTALNGG